MSTAGEEAFLILNQVVMVFSKDKIKMNTFRRREEQSLCRQTFF